MSEFKSYYTDKEYKLLQFPSVILIDTVNTCNLKCSMCVHKDMKRKKSFMPWEIFTKVIDEVALKNPKARIWMVFFGDPFMRVRFKPTIFDMVKYAKDKGCEDVVLNTNACLMDETNMKKIIEAGIDALYIGLDGFSEKTYSENRVGGDYDITKANVLGLLKYVKENNLTKPQVYTQFVEMDNNIHERDAFVEYWTKQGAHVKIRPMVTWIGKIERKVMAEPLPNRKACSWAMNTMVIAEDGQVANCACDLDVEYSFGNIKERSLENIWNNEMLAFREKHIEERFDELHSLCKNCDDWQSSGQKHYPAQK